MGFEQDIEALRKIEDEDEQAIVVFWFGRAALGEFEKIVKELSKIEMSPPKTPVSIPDPNFYETCVHIALNARGQIPRLIDGINECYQAMESRYDIPESKDEYLTQLQAKFSALIKVTLNILEFSYGRG